ncbi:MAG: glycolate oxidase subunit GlcE [Ferrovum sp. 37-45-19]|jgi:glycolate oxidase FAD binding subunit|nr:MAG: glycolate oxidase subunit GlcE [Ferrovum sp. 21-44-67]OYV93804.1 MAG: glycolate oxidase subunit GlcE [Ferrovum sp. 37-45-19]HQT82120.1 glycolate oxidase subunit GlcE [Ferrovaceae bacterium]HQU07168.1 glycolate oxidase subunit GlcE [Ferrovaceae bacterium]
MPNSITEIIEFVKNASQTERTINIAGSGSKAFWVNAQADLTLDMTHYKGIIEYEPSELVMSVKAGTPLDEVIHTLDREGQMLAFEPPLFSEGGSVGGMVASGLSGPRRAYTGSVRDYVLGVRVIDGLAQDLHFGGRVIKNVAGFDVSRLMVGALGSLGVIAEVSLKVMPKPQYELTLSYSLSETQALQKMNELASRPYPISATSFSLGELKIRFSGAEVAVKAAYRELGGEVVEKADLWWHSLRNQTYQGFHSQKPLWRLSVKNTAKPLGLSGQSLIEWGGALRWINSEHTPAQIFKVAVEAQGHAQLFRGGDPQHPISPPLSPTLIPIHQRLKHNFDPKGIFNPGLPGNF